MCVLDASALLAYLGGEPGGDIVEEALARPAHCGAANWCETAQKVRAAGGDWPLARALLLSFDLTIAPVTVDDAEEAARLWKRHSGLSLGDRLCLALAGRLGTVALTADRSWGSSPTVRQIR